ncbi:EAL domain-containing protein [Methylobacterium sp. E-005]|uniref:bifunctional diguanylate cyclase/phosphodiesterase n=1 Tax=Methylobacterium sp. E-005 TaxID=2836549 RepID=UPI001FB8D334|nr:EAL domain-containing protein [Methylobacterium sp. E-005]MCJ2086964.1 EAL domain-containing protein [Methylobacterium sp. E-005]
MIYGAARLAADHALGFVFTAVVICLAAGWLVATLMRTVSDADPAYRYRWIAGTAVVAGLGVWTTHFVAMLGYRPDMVLTFDDMRTIVSVLIAILVAGLPLAVARLFPSWRIRAVAGAIAGLSIVGMHYAGMAAIEGCQQTHSPLMNVLAAGIGACSLALACGLPRRLATPRVVCALFTLAVTGTHFVAIAGTTLARTQGYSGFPHENIVLSIFTTAGAAVLFLGAFLTIIATQRFDAQERAHSSVLRTALDNMSNGLLYLDASERVRLYNRRYTEIYGIPVDVDLTGRTIDQIIDIVGNCHHWTTERRVAARQRVDEWRNVENSRQIDYPLEDGRILQVEIRPIEEGGNVVTFDDVTKERAAQRRIAELAFSDPLTKLANRRALNARLDRDFVPKRVVKLLLIDLDRFKQINDTYGHVVGDQLLIQVANRLRTIAGSDGFVARLGGDEMAVLVYGDQAQAMAVATEVIEAIALPYGINDLTVSIGCSIGMCCTDDARDAIELMQFSDIALYESKRQGRGRTSCYTRDMLKTVADRVQLETDMRTAIERWEMHLAYQPVISLVDDRIIGYEALIRWDHPTLGAVSPARFIPLAEETGQIVPIGAWVLQEACRQAAQLPSDVYVAVNVSPVQLRSPQLLSDLTQALAKSGLPAKRLEIELTETAIVEDGPQIAKVLNAIRRLGVTVAMDDFGTGYSSLSHLRDLPLDRIKVDRSFVATAETDRHSLAVLKGITHIARALNVALQAEGVETPSQLALMRDVGCDAIQGYLVGRPQRLVESTVPMALSA